MKNRDTEMRELVSKLGTPPWFRYSTGGPYHSVMPNETGEAIISKGKDAVPYLIDRLDESTLDETIYILECLTQLRAPEARERVLQLKKDVDEGRKFPPAERDRSLEYQIAKYFWGVFGETGHRFDFTMPRAPDAE